MRYTKLADVGITTNKYHLEVLKDVMENHYILKIYEFSDVLLVQKDSLSSKKNIVTRKCENMEEVIDKIIIEVCRIL